MPTFAEAMSSLKQAGLIVRREIKQKIGSRPQGCPTGLRTGFRVQNF